MIPLTLLCKCLAWPWVRTTDDGRIELERQMEFYCFLDSFVLVQSLCYRQVEHDKRLLFLYLYSFISVSRLLMV